VETDPKAPRQPVPAADGGGYLKSIPGFSVARQGGTGGDPVMRGLGGTRLNVLLDNSYILGGCPHRMDPSATYAFPEAYDKITILKGPQSVLYGGGNIAGTVLIERNTPRFEAPGMRLSSSLLFGSFGRRDEFLDVTAGDTQGFVRIVGTQSQADNYSDGSGNEMHSFYDRKSFSGIVGITPDANTRIELSADVSDGKAAYRGMMDGAKFDRSGYGLKVEKTNLSPVIQKVDFNAYHNYVDHVMDNFSLRPLAGMAMVSNPDRSTNGGRLAAKLTLSDSTAANVGVDYQENKHTTRGGTNYASKPRTPDMTFRTAGIFGDVAHKLDMQNRLLGGLRADFQDVAKQNAPADTASDTTYGAFLRYEHDYKKSPVTSYIGIGHAERPADYWERKLVFTLKPEKNTQLDTGLIYHSGKVRSSLSVFYANIDDFILVTGSGTSARNINATTYGAEADYAYSPGRNLTVTATLAYVRGENATDHKPLAQMPPLEGTLGLKYTNKELEAGLLWRLVAAQKRVDAGNGTEIGTDIGPSGGFGVLSAHVAYRSSKRVLLTAGIDNILDKTYAEFISRNVDPSIAGLGLPVTARINEPGRNYWVKANYLF